MLREEKGLNGGGVKAVHAGAYKALAAGFYLLGLAWYVKEGYTAYGAIHEAAHPYPFIMDMSPWSVAGFSFTGGLYWTTFGLDRSNTPAAIAGYVMAGAHVLVFALQFWIGPYFWALSAIE